MYAHVCMYTMCDCHIIFFLQASPNGTASFANRTLSVQKPSLAVVRQDRLQHSAISPSSSPLHRAHSTGGGNREQARCMADAVSDVSLCLCAQSNVSSSGLVTSLPSSRFSKSMKISSTSCVHMERGGVTRGFDCTRCSARHSVMLRSKDICICHI